MAESNTIVLKLVQIQRELKAPKGQFNSFGKYHYRSCEDITEAAKPLCAKYNAALTLEDDVVEIGGRFYIKAVARLTDADNGSSITASAFAREEETKKGMDASQLTGATSSYARKYALSGLFALDDTKDSDYTNTGEGGGADKKPTLNAQIEAMGQENPYVCADCGKPFGNFEGKNGRIYSPAEVYEMAKARSADGLARCKDCREKAES